MSKNEIYALLISLGASASIVGVAWLRHKLNEIHKKIIELDGITGPMEIGEDTLREIDDDIETAKGEDE